jgi:pseudouridine kinase
MREGERGSYVCTRGARPVHLPAVPVDVVDVTGAGDAMLAGWIVAWLRGADPVDAARDGHRAAAATIASPYTVRPDLAEAMATFDPPTPREVTDVDDH